MPGNTPHNAGLGTKSHFEIQGLNPRAVMAAVLHNDCKVCVLQ